MADVQVRVKGWIQLCVTVLNNSWLNSLKHSVHAAWAHVSTMLSEMWELQSNMYNSSIFNSYSLVAITTQLHFFFIFIIFVQNVKCSHTASVMVFRPACYISSCCLLMHIQYITHITRWHRHVGSSCAARAYCCKNTFIFKPSVYFIKRRSNVGNDMSMSQQNLKSCLNILDLCLLSKNILFGHLTLISCS